MHEQVAHKGTQSASRRADTCTMCIICMVGRGGSYVTHEDTLSYVSVLCTCVFLHVLLCMCTCAPLCVCVCEKERKRGRLLSHFIDGIVMNLENGEQLLCHKLAL